MINFSQVRPETFAGKIVRYPFRALPRDLAVPILQGPLRGKRWIVGAHLHGCWLGSYEWEMQKCIARELKPGAVFYDVGANVGFYTLLAASLFPSNRVYAMEPLPANVRYLRRHLELNRVRNVEVLEVAISNHAGTAQFAEEETRAMGHLTENGAITVKTTSLDLLLREAAIAPPDFIKMDIEGAEADALPAAHECFSKYRPKLFLATHGTEVHEACCRQLTSWDYQFEYVDRQSKDRAELFAFPRKAQT